MKACFGSDAKALLAGRASEAGVVCAELAHRGASGPEHAIEDKNGFVNLFNDGIFDRSSVAAIGRRWYLETPESTSSASRSACRRTRRWTPSRIS